MHLLFYGGTQIKVLHNQTVETVLKDLSIRVSLTRSRVVHGADAQIHSKGRYMTVLSLLRISRRSSRHTAFSSMSYSNQISRSTRASTTFSTAGSSPMRVLCRTKTNPQTLAARLTAVSPSSLRSTSRKSSGSRAITSPFLPFLVWSQTPRSRRHSQTLVSRVSVSRQQITIASTVQSMQPSEIPSTSRDNTTRVRSPSYLDFGVLIVMCHLYSQSAGSQ